MLVEHTLFKGFTRPARVGFPGRVTLGAASIVLMLMFAVALFFPLSGFIVGGVLYVICALVEQSEPFKVRYIALGLFVKLLCHKTSRLLGASSWSPWAED